MTASISSVVLDQLLQKTSLYKDVCGSILEYFHPQNSIIGKYKLVLKNSELRKIIIGEFFDSADTDGADGADRILAYFEIEEKDDVIYIGIELFDKVSEVSEVSEESEESEDRMNLLQMVRSGYRYP